MNIIFLTADDPLYLPDFFETVLATCAHQVQSIFVAPPLYKNETALEAAHKYYQTFGFADSARLAQRVFGSKLRNRSIASVCKKYKVPFAPVADVNAPQFLSALRAYSCEVVVSVSCPQIFKAPLISLSPRGILNIHGAILPHYRGVMPSFWMLANGEKMAGVSIYFVNQQIDAGELCAQETFAVNPKSSLDRFLRQSKEVAANLLLGVLRKMEEGEIPRWPLNLAEGSYYSWPDREAVSRFRSTGRDLW